MNHKIGQVLSVREAIESRRSIRKFVQEPISNEVIQQILELVRLTPSAWNIQPWRFHVITDHTLKEKLKEAAYGQKQVTSAPVVILVTSDMEDAMVHLSETIHPGLTEERKREELINLLELFDNMSIEERGQWGLAQANIALGFLLIAIQGMGYASCPMLGFNEKEVKEILALPEHIKFAAMVAFGLPASEGYTHHRLLLNNMVKFVSGI
jgi:nitroreductase